MKKIAKKLMLVIVMAALCFAVAVTANAETWNDFEYTVLEDETVEITGYSGSEADVEIPSVIADKAVTAISDGAFYGNYIIESVYIPDSIIDIGNGSFEFCINLKNITVGENNAFYFTDEYGVLYDKNITLLIQYPVGNDRAEYTVPSTVKTIGYGAFDGAVYIEKIDLPEGLLTIDEFAFQYCTSLKDIKFPDSLTFLGDGAIAWCMALTEITIPEKIMRINSNGASVYSCYFIDKVYIESIDCDPDSIVWYMNLPISLHRLSGLSQERAIELVKLMIVEMATGEDLGAYAELESYLEWIEVDSIYDLALSTVYCHAGATTEALAKEYGFAYELTHFFKGEWTYDYENMVRFRKCIHCDELETEQLEVTENGDVEIINPSDPDTDFTVDEIVKGGDNYVIIENVLGGNITGDWEIVKAFDITLKNHDGVHVQPDGTVKVKLPLDWSKDGIYKVYRVNDDGTLTDMNAYRQGSHMVFETDHFSIYVIVDESEKADIPEDDPTEAPAEKLDFIQKLLNFFTSLLEFFRSLFGI